MKSYIIVVALAFGILGHSQSLNDFFTKSDAFFKSNVKSGKVDYKGIKSNPEALNELLSIAEGISVSTSDTKNYQAFWINAYNLSVIKGLVNKYPTTSPLDHDGFFDKTTYSLGGKQITLNDIENKLLRAKFNDARFHFVLVCGALGCPPIINSAYKPSTLDAQMQAQTVKALNGDFLRVNTKKERVEVSEIMKWYKEDFVTNGQSEIDFINTYREDKIPSNFKLSYFPYNWTINEQ
ncbi:DUF547 domain-containing protein [Winogradskyella maritima]|uniref:DUF547 domain-containing protein n=1 Tax=Winogradskyella maritima TaxID=1517766 RepID=A0ABV8AJ01_9FLAO|nr:DUF547 domain-containing protein [Winogradskyella maritima]